MIGVVNSRTDVNPSHKPLCGMNHILPTRALNNYKNNICYSFGTHSMYGAANTMSVFCEAIGIAPVGSTTLPSCSAAKQRQARDADERAVELALTGKSFRAFVTQPAFENGIRHASATGGSTNFALHAVSLSRVLGFPINLRECDRIQALAPVIAKFKPRSAIISRTDISVGRSGQMDNDLLCEKELSPTTIRNINGVLHGALEQAIACGHIRVNPFRGLKPPEVKNPSIHPFMDEEMDAFLAAIKGNEYEALFDVTLHTGLRQSEVMGLSWDRVDFKKGTLLIDRQLIHEKKKGGAYKFAPPKNDEERTLTPAPSVMELLRAVKRRQGERRLRCGSDWDNSMGLVFTNELGAHYCHTTIAHNFNRVVEGMGLTDRRFHDLRHFYAVMQLQAGVDPKTVSKALGHATVAFTLDVYGHVSKKMD